MPCASPAKSSVLQSSAATASFSLVVRLLRRMYSLCLARFFIAAMRVISEPVLALCDLTPPNDLRAPVLERIRPPAGEPSTVPWAAAALRAPSFAITRERDMRGLRATNCFGFGGNTAGRGIFDGELAGSTLPMIDVAAAVSDG